MATSRKQGQLVFTLPLFVENMFWACYFTNVYAAMSLLKLFEVHGINPKHESVKTSDYLMLTYTIQ